MTECKHFETVWEDVAVEHYITGEVEIERQSREVHWTQDIGIGAYQCTRCRKVMFYTGLWREFYEKKRPCPASELVRPYDAEQVRRAMKEYRP